MQSSTAALAALNALLTLRSNAKASAQYASCVPAIEDTLLYIQDPAHIVTHSTELLAVLVRHFYDADPVLRHISATASTTTTTNNNNSSSSCSNGVGSSGGNGGGGVAMGGKGGSIERVEMEVETEANSTPLLGVLDGGGVEREEGEEGGGAAGASAAGAATNSLPDDIDLCS